MFLRHNSLREGSKCTDSIRRSKAAQTLLFDTNFVSLNLNGRPLIQAGRSGTIIHYDEYTHNFKEFLELRTGRKKLCKEFLQQIEELLCHNKQS